MPRKKRLSRLPVSPAPDWSDFRSGARPAIYSTEFVQELARTFKIDLARIPELKTALEDWADVYWFHKAGFEESVRSGKIKAELEFIKSRINALKSTLENLHPEIEHRFWQPESEIIKPSPDSGEQIIKSTSPYGHTIFKIQLSPKQGMVFYINKAHHFESLTILQNYADAAIAKLPEDRGGRIRSEALRMWVENVRSYWKNVLKRQFTAKKQSAAFCIAAFRPIDPTFPASRITTAIRHVLEKPRKPKNAETTSK
jgi:hypothetical protein